MTPSRVAILSDVNANLPALTACLSRVDELGVDRVVFLGDAVGYGADPGACFDLLRERADTYLLGRWRRCSSTAGSTASTPRRAA